MARSGDIIEHPLTGERITFLRTAAETDGAYSRYELAVSPAGLLAAPHVHSQQVERFEVVAGTFAFVVDGEEWRIGPDEGAVQRTRRRLTRARLLRPGEGAVVPARTPHLWWNAGDEEGVAIVEVRPALRTEEFLESLFGLAQDGLVDPRTGLPEQPWLALLARRYHRDVTYLTEPPLPVQLERFAPIAAEAARRGYRLPYPYPYARLHERELLTA